MLYRVRKTFTLRVLISSSSWNFKSNFVCSEVSAKQQYDHPEFRKIMESLEEYDGIKYNAYRVAFKIYALQKHLRGRCKCYLLTLFLPFMVIYRISDRIYCCRLYLFIRNVLSSIMLNSY